MSVRLRTLGLVAAVALLGSGLLTMSSAGAATPQSVPTPLSRNRPVTASPPGDGPQWMVDVPPGPPRNVLVGQVTSSW
jgi:hypothetical protein